MRALSSADILRIWESGACQHPIDQALTVLAGAGEQRDALGRLSIGERDRRLWGLREATFGTGVEALTRCPACGGRIEFQFSVSDVRVPAVAASDLEHELNVGDWSIRFRLPESRDLAAIATVHDATRAEAELAARCLVRTERDGREAPHAEVPQEAWEAVQRRMSELDPQAEVHFELSCPACDHQWLMRFDIARFLWAELAALAQRLLREVDLLARTYGWSEAAILDLSPGRRAAYLELAAS